MSEQRSEDQTRDSAADYSLAVCVDATARPRSVPTMLRRVKRKLSATTTLDDILDGWTQCCHLLPAKRRLCNVARVPGSQFCGQHRPADDPTLSDNSTRIPCPVDGSHDIYKYNLSAHVKVCTAKTRAAQLQALPYFKQGCNCSDGMSEVGTLREVDPDLLLSKLLKVFEDHVKSQLTEPDVLPADHAFHLQSKRVSEEVAGQKTAFSARRHIFQDVAIVSHMISNGLLTISDSSTESKTSNNTMYVEFGAGRGVLGLVLSSFLPKAPIVLLERAGCRKKADRSMRELGRPFHRVRMDIRDCYLPALATSFCSSEPTPDMVVAAKHLCGAATDFALKGSDSFSAPETSFGSLKGFAIATCCHHACSWKDYVGVEWLKDMDFDESEFCALAQWSGWQSLSGTISQRRPRALESDQIDDDSEDEAAGAATAAARAPRPRGITADEMLAAGTMAKRVIDQGRVQFLTSRGFVAKQQRFCDPSCSPECVLIVATKVAKE